MMNDSTTEPQKITGRVKWFDPAKGFGFILNTTGGTDILLHSNVLRNFGQSSVAEDAIITVLVHATPRGCQALEILEIIPPETSREALDEGFGGLQVDQIDALPIEPARVKWFDKAKGFGFANIFGKSEDIFLHLEILRRSGFADLAPGEAICLRTVSGARGKMAVQILSWDVACQE